MAKSKIKKVTIKNKKSGLNPIKLLWIIVGLAILIAVIWTVCIPGNRKHSEVQDLDSFRAQPYNRVRPLITPKALPTGISPSQAKSAYNLNGVGGGSGTIAIIIAYDNSRIESDLATFSRQFGLRSCTTANGCFEKVKMSSRIPFSSDWAIEAALDVEWAHAIAPGAKILLVEARTNSGTDLLKAVNYARNRSDVKAISMSWGGDEFSNEVSYESYFISRFGATFFASSGDSGHGTSWPAVSANVVSVGGTTLNLLGGSFSSETAWSGSGGGKSTYIGAPSYQSTFGVPSASAKRVTPDVSYDANPSTGFPVFQAGWYQVGGTSAGAPQWAALRAINSNITLSRLYSDATSHYSSNFRDILSGTNGGCGTLCTAQTGFDHVTGLGSPLGVNF